MKNPLDFIPLLAPKPIWDYSPEEFRNYIKDWRASYQARQHAKALARKPKSKSPVPGINFRVNDKGTPIFTFRTRKPKWISPNEIVTLAKHHKVPQNQMWLWVRDKGIEVKKPEIEVQLGETL